MQTEINARKERKKQITKGSDLRFKIGEARRQAFPKEVMRRQKLEKQEVLKQEQNTLFKGKKPKQGPCGRSIPCMNKDLREGCEAEGQEQVKSSRDRAGKAALSPFLYLSTW